jgi:hypothetical protein
MRSDSVWVKHMTPFFCSGRRARPIVYRSILYCTVDNKIAMTSVAMRGAGAVSRMESTRKERPVVVQKRVERTKQARGVGVRDRK